MTVKTKDSFVEVLNISDAEDFSVNIRTSKPRKIPTKTVSLYLEDMDIKDTINQPFLFIILPFFTSKRQRNANLVYEIANAGIKFGASLSTDNFEGIRNQQPSDFEKNVFYFILYKFQELLMDKEKNDNRFIVFNIEEVIDYLGLKFSMKYYRKMEETLYNLQATTYKIAIRNRKKAGNIIREVYKEPLNLVKYEKIKEKNIETNKMKVYYKVRLDERIIDELKRKHYSIFDRHLLNDLRKADRAAEKIYQYISMKRFSDNIGEQRIETLATIVPLTTTSRIKKKLKNGTVKEYEVSKLKQVLRRIRKCFDVLVSKGYLSNYSVEELKDLNSYKFIYNFNLDKDNSCHISSLVENNKPQKLTYKSKPETISTKEPTKAELKEISESIKKEISKAKKNIFVSKAWNKRVDNKILKLLKEEGEEYTKYILKVLYENLYTDINKTLVSYISGIMKNLKKQGVTFDKKKKDNLQLIKDDKKAVQQKLKISDQEITDAEIIEEVKVEPKKELKKVSSREVDTSDPINNLLLELYEKMTSEEKQDMEDKARNRYLNMTNSKSFNSIHEKIFKTTEKVYILEIMRKEKGLA